jgi:hypothetical protein
MTVNVVRTRRRSESRSASSRVCPAEVEQALRAKARAIVGIAFDQVFEENPSLKFGTPNFLPQEGQTAHRST